MTAVPRRWNRRTFHRWAAAAALSISAGCRRSTANAAATLKIGFQKSGTMALLRLSGKLERQSVPLGVSVSWTEFPAGPQLLEALHVGAVDFGHAGDSPPIFAQAAGVEFRYVAASRPSPSGSGIVVAENSRFTSAADLKGSKIAFTKGSSAHTLVLRALESKGLSIADVQPAYLSPADARAALEKGAVDAWSIWDPYLALIEKSSPVRVLLRGDGLVAGREFYLASRRLLASRRDWIQATIAEIDAIGRWASDRPRESAEMLAPVVGLEVDVLETAFGRRGRFGALPMSKEIVAEQQAVADGFRRIGLLPRSIQVDEFVFRQEAPETSKGRA